MCTLKLYVLIIDRGYQPVYWIKSGEFSEWIS